ncbi:MAG: type II toxin-antitoxin system mRNA interferase toxin, RelE/StbE family [Bdellovibrio sp.]|nr:type II toxin-antitoxin system mRNA interferase toxin, RelE/StbE family [Bdellovibrio sp.]
MMDACTKVTSTKSFEKQLLKVPDFIRKKVIFWIFLVETNGLAEVMKSAGYHDEPLKGERKGQRSVRMNKAYRLIYHAIENRIHIELLEVHKHDY